MDEPIRISALGRDARVGDFYNYFTDAIFSSGIEVPKEYKSISETKNEKTFVFYKHTDKYKRHMLGINSHLHDSIEKNFVDLKKLWFANYLNANTECDDNEAHVTVFIQVIRRIETLDSCFFFQKMHEYRLRSYGRATHLMEQVVYGAEMIFSIRKIIDWERDTKESVEGSLYLAVKDYFDQVIDKHSDIKQFPIELDAVTCTILSSLEAGNELKFSFQESIQYLRNVINSHEDEKSEKWKPIEMVLRDIPIQIETRLWSESKSDIEFLKEKHQITWQWIVKESRNLLNNTALNRFPLLERVMCQFKDLLQPFWEKIQILHGENGRTLEQVLKEMKLISEFLTNMTDWLAQRRKEIEAFGLLLNGTQLDALDMEDIKTRMRNAVEKFANVFVLKVNYNPNVLVKQMQNKMRDLPSAFELPFLTFTRLDKERFAEVRKQLHEFASEADLKRGDPTRDTCYHIALVPSYSSLYDGQIQVWDFSDKLSEQFFVASDDQKDLLVNFEQRRQKVTPSICPELPPLISTKDSTPKQQQLMNDPYSYDGSHRHAAKGEENENMEVESSTSILSEDLEGMEGIENSNGADGSADQMVQFMADKTETNPLTQQVDSTQITNIHQRRGNEATGQDSLVKDFIQLEMTDTQDMSPTSVAASIQKSGTAGRNQQVDDIVSPSESSGDHERKKTTRSNSSSGEAETKRYRETDSEANENTRKNHRKQERENEYDKSSNNQQQVHEEPSSNQSISEFFSTNRQYSQLIKKGQPNIYLLKARESLISDDFRCFDMGQPEGSMPSHGMRNHKVIILMGATGCGKSTLINGMVNYILGVQWKDPFRFKCVREDETTARNQAHSQTSSVTAYTIRHHQGMTVPYSITIIDTPGYGDTRGVKRDKEITRKIHQFLTQQETRVDEIHAACFVAASGNSRLTATQGYIIDSVLSIFGKDVKENIRLLVTFADNAHPPVVEACLAANFPVTSASAGITFSKFNSSVLYANNKQQGEDDFCFDELFWDMGQENFHKFFTMLKGMNGKDLKSTRNVIQSRKLLEQSLEDIEQELEVCFVKIENMEMFHRKMKEHGHKMESNKNYTVEKTEMQLTKVPCDKGFFANNCHRCRNTCERPIKQKKTESLQNKKRKCDKEFCVCPASEHEFQQFEWRMTPVKITTTLKDMKAEYESNYDDKITVEQLLADCSYELNMAKAKVFSLLDQVGKNVRLLESTALRSNALTPSDYLSLIKSRVAEEQAPGYLTRLETLAELQNCLAADASASASQQMVRSIPYQTHQSSKTSGTSRGGDFRTDRDRSKTSQLNHPSTTDNRMASKKFAGAANYNASVSNTRSAGGHSLYQPNNQLPITTLGVANSDFPTSKKFNYGSDSKEDYSSDDNKDKKNKKGFFASVKDSVTATVKELF